MTGLSEFYQVAGLEKRQERQKAFNPLLSVFLPFYSIVIYQSCVFCCPRLALLKKTLKQTNKTWQDITHTHTHTRTRTQRERERERERERNADIQRGKQSHVLGMFYSAAAWRA